LAQDIKIASTLRYRNISFKDKSPPAGV